MEEKMGKRILVEIICISIDQFSVELSDKDYKKFLEELSEELAIRMEKPNIRPGRILKKG